MIRFVSVSLSQTQLNNKLFFLFSVLLSALCWWRNCTAGSITCQVCRLPDIHFVIHQNHLPRDAMHSADYAVERCQSVRMSVRPSVSHTPVFCRNGWTYHQSFSPSVKQTLLLFFPTKRYDNVSTGTSLRGRRMQAVWKNRNFRPISRFLSETIQDIP